MTISYTTFLTESPNSNTQRIYRGYEIAGVGVVFNVLVKVNPSQGDFRSVDSEVFVPGATLADFSGMSWSTVDTTSLDAGQKRYVRTYTVGGLGQLIELIRSVKYANIEQIGSIDVLFTGGPTKAIDQTARVWHVGSASWMYPTIQDAITAINADPTPPTFNNRAVVMIWPGYYTMTAPITVPSWVGIKGVSKGLVQLYNDTTNMFVCSDNVWFEDFLVEGAPTTSISVFYGNNATGVHIRRVDMLKNNGNNKQRFIYQSGSTWTTWLIDHCVIDWWATSNYLNLFVNTSGVARMVDVHLNDIFFDALHLTTYGHCIGIRGCQDVYVKNATIRGIHPWVTGVRLELGGVTGTPYCWVRHSGLEGGVPVYGEAGTTYYLINSDAVGALTAGSRVVRNSAV